MRMKRQTRPFIVEFKKGPRGPNGGTAAKPLWHGHDLALLKETEQDSDRVAVAMSPSNPEVAILPGRILQDAVASPVTEIAMNSRPARPTKVGPKPATPKMLPTAIPEIVPPLEPVVAETSDRAPIRLRKRVQQLLPRGQRWKHRLPKVLQ